MVYKVCALIKIQLKTSGFFTIWTFFYNAPTSLYCLYLLSQSLSLSCTFNPPNSPSSLLESTE